MTKKILALILCALMLTSSVTVLTSCVGEVDGNRDFDDDERDDEDRETKKNDDKSPVVSGSDTDAQTKAPETEAPETTAPVEKEEVEIDTTMGAPLPAGITAEKIGSTEYKNISYGNFAYAYAKDGKAWIATYDGKSNVKTEYANIMAKGDYFLITAQTTTKVDPTKLEQINTVGLIDVNGKLIAPMQYSSINTPDGRYVTAFRAISEITDEKNALVKLPSYSSTDSKEHYYAGEWVVYDLVEGKLIDGIKGTKYPTNTSYGNILSYKNDAGERIKYAPFGNIDQKASVFDDGTYKLDGVVYGADGKELFKLKKDGFEPSSISSDGNYYVARKYSREGASYAVMDKTGKIVSAEFPSLIFIRGKMLEVDSKIYFFDGKLAYDGEFTTFSHERHIGIDVYKAEGKERVVFFDGAFNIIYDAPKDANIRAYLNVGTPTKTENKVNTVYCYKDKAFSIDGNGISFMLSYSGSAGAYTLKEVITGSTLIESASSYSVAESEDGSQLILLAKTATGYDFYNIKAK